MAIIFHLRSDDVNFLARVSHAGNVPGVYGAVTSDTSNLPTGTIGSRIINQSAASNNNFLLYRGFESIPLGRPMSVLHRFSIESANPAAAGVLGLFNISGPDDLKNDKASINFWNNFLVSSMTGPDGFVGISNATSTFVATQSLIVDLVLTYTGDTTSNGWKIYINTALVDQKTSTRSYDTTRDVIRINKIAIGVAELDFNTSTEIKTNEFVIWDEIIDPTSGGLNLNGAARNFFVTSTPFDGLNSTDPGVSKVLTSAGNYFVNGIEKVPTLGVSSCPIESDVSTGVDYIEGGIPKVGTRDTVTNVLANRTIIGAERTGIAKG